MDIYANEYSEQPMQVDDPELQEAIDLINDYTLDEFGHIEITEGFDLSRIGLMYTTDENDSADEPDYMIELQVEADLINKAINYFVNNDLRHQDKFSSYAEMNEVLEGLYFDDMYGECLGYITDQDREDSQY